MRAFPRDKVLVVALHRQRPDQDAVVVRRLRDAIDAYRERLSGAALMASGQTPEEFLSTGIEGVRYFRRSTVALWGPYDSATFYLADDVVSIIRIGSSCGASAHELLFGPLFGTDEDNQAAMRALLGEVSGSSPPVILFSRMKLNDPFLSVCGQPLRAAYAGLAMDMASGAGVLCLAMNAWSSHELAFVLLGDDAATLLRLSERLERVTLGDLLFSSPELEVRTSLAMAVAPARKDGDNIPKGILRRWAMGRRSNVAGKPDDVLKQAAQGHVVVAARAQLGLHLRAASARVESQWASYKALRSASRRAIDIMQPEPEISVEKAPAGSAVLMDLSDWSTSLKDANPHYETLPHVSAMIQWIPKPGHVHAVYSAVKDLAAALALRDHVRLGTGGRTTTVSLRVEVPAGEAGCLLLYAITLWLRVDPKISAHIADTTTMVELNHESPANAARQTDSWIPGSRTTTDPSELRDARGYLLFEYPRTEALARFERKKLRAIGLRSAESLALQNLFATVQHTLGQPEMFGTMLDVGEVTDEIGWELCLAESVARDDLFTATPLLTGYAQRAYQQRLQFSPAMDGTPAIGGEVPYGISQLVGTASGVASVILRLVDIVMQEVSPGRKRPTPPIVLLSPDAAVAMRGIRSTGVFHLSSSQAMTPMSLYLFFHELGHWMVRFWRPPAAHGRRLTCLGDLATDLVKRLAPETLWSVDRVERFWEDVLAHASWRHLGCNDEWPLFRTQFLSAPAMGIRIGEPPHSFNAALECWAETALHLHVQQRLWANADSLDAVLGELRQRRAESFDDTVARIRHAIGRTVRSVLPFAFAQLASTLARSDLERGVTRLPAALDEDALRLELHRALTTETWKRAMLLLMLDDCDKHSLDQLTGELLRFIAGWGKRLRTVHDTFALQSRDYRHLRGRIARGESPDAPPWTLLDAGGKPGLEAFLWVRSILSGVADHFEAECQGRSRHGVLRDAMNHVRGNTLHQGIFTDHLGGLYRVGRAARTWCLNVHVTALVALQELSYRVRAGQVDRYFRHQRSFPRHDAAYSVSLSSRNRVYECTVCDISPVGVGLRLASADCESLKPRERVVLHTQPDKVECEIVWSDLKHAPGRMGLKVLNRDPFIETHWADRSRGI